MVKRLLINVSVAVLVPFLLFANLPHARAEVFRPGIDLGDLRVPRKTSVEIFVCRAAMYQVAYAESFQPLYESIGLQPAKRTAVILAAQKFADESCSGDARGAKLAFEVYRDKLTALADNYATIAGVTRAVAVRVLRDLQYTLLAQAAACGGVQGNVSSFLNGGVTGTINIVGAPIHISGPTSVVSLSGALGSCGGGGAGGGGGLGRGDLSIPGSMNGGKLAQCITGPKPLAPDCPLADPNDEDEDLAQDELDDVHEEQVKGTNVKMTRHHDGSFTLTDGNGNTITLLPNEGPSWSDWIDIGADLFMAVRFGRDLIIALETGAAGGPIALGATGLALAVYLLCKDTSEVVDRSSKPVQFIIVPGKLCPVQVGGGLGWWTNPSGEALNGADVFSVCVCNAGTGRMPSRCQSRGEAELNKTVDCAIEPYATPGDAALCEDILMGSNPDLDRGRASSAVCGYKDCGTFAAPNYNAATDVCGCSSSGGAGAITLPDEWLWTDPLPINP